MVWIGQTGSLLQKAKNRMKTSVFTLLTAVFFCPQCDKLSQQKL